LPKNIRLGWRGFPRTNTLTYCDHSKIVKSFNIKPRFFNVKKPFSSVTGITVKQARVFLAILLMFTTKIYKNLFSDLGQVIIFVFCETAVGS
jgi:hypothetical protein